MNTGFVTVIKGNFGRNIFHDKIVSGQDPAISSFIDDWVRRPDRITIRYNVFIILNTLDPVCQWGGLQGSGPVHYSGKNY